MWRFQETIQKDSFSKDIYQWNFIDWADVFFGKFLFHFGQILVGQMSDWANKNWAKIFGQMSLGNFRLRNGLATIDKDAPLSKQKDKTYLWKLKRRKKLKRTYVV